MREATRLSKKKGKIKTFLESEIRFPKAPKRVKDKVVLFNKLLSFVKDNKESFNVKVESGKRKRYIILDADEFMFAISFGRKPSTKIMVHDPKKNIEVVNDIGNKMINYMNTILDEGATGTCVSSSKSIFYPKTKKIVNLGIKIIGERRVAQINELVKHTLKPVGIFFQFKVDKKRFAFATYSNKRNAELLLSTITYKDKMPFDLLRTEYEGLATPTEIIKKLIELEL